MESFLHLPAPDSNGENDFGLGEQDPRFGARSLALVPN